MTIVQGNSYLLGDLVRGRRFDVPEIQRPYAFSINNSDDAEAISAGATFLKNDLLSFHRGIEDTDRNYFLGSIIVQSSEGFDSEDVVYDLLDGQQRMTTLSLLFNEIYRTLVEHEDWEEWVLEHVAHNWLFFDRDLFDEPEPMWRYCLYPRRTTDRQAYRLAMDGANLAEFPEGNIRDVVEDFRQFVTEFDGLEELAKFADTLLKRVEIVMLCVPDTAMAFQMFQTANARGTPLSQLDMFRSTVVMQCRTQLNLPNNQIQGILGALRGIEKSFTEKYEKEDKRSKAIDKFMKYWIWIRRGSDSGGVSYIMKMVEDCDNYQSLIYLVSDLLNHVEVWCDEVDVSFSSIPPNTPLHPLFPKITDGWKMFYLAVRTAAKYPRGGYMLTTAKQQKLLNLMMWWYLKDFTHGGATNPTPFRSSWAALAHRTWHHNVMCTQEWAGWNDASYAEELAGKIGYFTFTAFPQALSSKFEVNDRDAKNLVAALAQFERHGPGGLGNMRMGSMTTDTNLVHLVPPNILTPDQRNSIGNWTLINGSGRGGRNIASLNQDVGSWETTQDRLTGLIDDISVLSRTDAWPVNMGDVEQARRFVRRRNSVILEVLNWALDGFRNQQFEG